MTVPIPESKVINWLWFPMATAVVMNHTGSQGVWSPYSIYATLCIVIPETICRIAVPLFFTFSGYLFFKGFEHWNKNVYRIKIRYCFHKLLVPYLFWNILAAVFLYSYSYLRMRLGSVPYLSLSDQVHQWKGLRIFWDCDKGLPLNYSLWYFRDLILYIVLSPALQYLLKKVRWVGVFLLGIAYLVFDSFHFLGGLFFFSLGSQLRFSQRSIQEISFSLRWPA